ncbi:Cof-type HAD-IIB family hydrolase [Endozoicomonas sp. SCSIO W0465]|uniref:Cof-type HAD-IIB family hydrolase n=1 Tax=Endozoicomonas sp. SCSIO W0465 TaxID=2918516 RepID=UPI0020758C62|nr:Cof-type HAD-IIB family hydrolase [Endozoicomonas sp. SCSIO W0465]USE36229.1 Cof-type HAD-IIB family hydrolase [Endozoicomonas sp. SCSIO W0465]
MTGCTVIKLIAVDMDGTFLKDNKTYNRERFLEQFKALKARGIRFVVASGNQYYKLRSYFEGIDAGDIAYVAENGGYVHDGQQALFVADIAVATLNRVYPFLNSLKAVTAIICGRDSAYVLNTADPAEVANARNHYQRLELIQSYRDINDTILKIAIKMSPDIHESVLEAARKELGDVLVSVTSGHEWIDLIIPGVHKAHGIHLLQEQWNIADDEVAAFGDSGNDIEMLQKAGFSFAMNNASDSVRQVARYSAPANNDEGVLDTIDHILSGELDKLS